MSNKKKLVFLTGAGISAESGILTFRDSGGLWENHNVEDVATYTAWEKNPELVQAFYNARRAQLSTVEPNSAHIALKDFEEEYDVSIITTNVDDLHERAGSTNILHLHGSLRHSKGDNPEYAWVGFSCNNIQEKIYPIEGDEIVHGTLCPEGFMLRPHVVWFGEPVPEIENAADIVKEADILVIIGTSLAVYPANGLFYYAPEHCKLFYIDPNADTDDFSNSITVIKEVATTGVLKLKEILNDKS